MNSAPSPDSRTTSSPDPHATPRAAAALLAAGAGSRFAGPTHKLLAPLGDTRVIDQAIANLSATSFAHRCIVLGAVDPWAEPSTKPSAELTILQNPNWENGIATSLQTAIAWADQLGCEVLVVGLADQPFVRPACWEAVAAALAPPATPTNTPATSTPKIAIATYDETPTGTVAPANPVALHKDIWPQLPTSGDEGARLLIRSQPELCVRVACDGDPSDIDTQEDLRKWN